MLNYNFGKNIFKKNFKTSSCKVDKFIEKYFVCGTLNVAIQDIIFINVFYCTALDIRFANKLKIKKYLFQLSFSKNCQNKN